MRKIRRNLRKYDWRYYSGMPGTCKVRTNKVVYFVQNPICFTGSFVKTEILWAFFAYFARTRKPQKRMAAFASSAVGSTTGTVRPTASAAKGSSVQPSRNTPAPTGHHMLHHGQKIRPVSVRTFSGLDAVIDDPHEGVLLFRLRGQVRHTGFPEGFDTVERKAFPLWPEFPRFFRGTGLCRLPQRR